MDPASAILKALEDYGDKCRAESPCRGGASYPDDGQAAQVGGKQPLRPLSTVSHAESNFEDLKPLPLRPGSNKQLTGRSSRQSRRRSAADSFSVLTAESIPATQVHGNEIHDSKTVGNFPACSRNMMQNEVHSKPLTSDTSPQRSLRQLSNTLPFAPSEAPHPPYVATAYNDRPCNPQITSTQSFVFDAGNDQYDAEALRRPPRSFRSSLHRISSHFSFTPGDMPYPGAFFKEADDYAKAEELLGLRRRTTPPPVPPKNDAPWTSLDEEPIYNSIWATESQFPRQIAEAGTLEPEPLNGRTAWLHALTGFLVIFNCWGLSNSFGVMQAYYERYYLAGTSPSAVAWIGSTQLALVFGLGVPVGRLVDKGYFRLVFHTGSLLMVSSIFISSFCAQWWSVWLTQGLMTGFGMGMVFCSGIVVMMTWFDETKMGAAMALGAAGSCVGGIVYVLLLRHFLASVGFATTMRIVGSVCGVTMIPANLVYRVRGKENTRIPARAKPREQRKGIQQFQWRTFASPAYLLAGAGMWCSFLGVYFGFVYMVSYGVTELQLSNTAATNLLIFMLAANLPGRFLPAMISDRCIGPLNTVIPATILSSACIWLWMAGNNNRSSLTVVACFYGFVSAGVQVLYAPTVYTFCLEPAEIEKPLPETPTSMTQVDNNKRHQVAIGRMGLKAGCIFTLIGIACLIGTPIGGALISYRRDRGLDKPYLGAQCFAGASLMVGGCLLLASRVAKAGWGPGRA